MLALTACLTGLLAILVIEKLLRKQGILKGENDRKFVHISVGIFVAMWPWLLSWRMIQFIAVAMLVVNLIDRHYKFFKFNITAERRTYGELLFPVTILLCAALTNIKIFFALAVLHLSVADGLAAVVGGQFIKHWSYKVFHYTKTVIGTMTFWLVSLAILGIGLLFTHSLIGYPQYGILILALPPILAILENAGGFWGTDNILVPLTVLMALNLAKTF